VINNNPTRTISRLSSSNNPVSGSVVGTVLLAGIEELRGEEVLLTDEVVVDVVVPESFSGC
jgi:hypothetical protein